MGHTVCMKNEKELLARFYQTGRIEEYLAYRRAKDGADQDKVHSDGVHGLPGQR